MDAAFLKTIPPRPLRRTAPRRASLRVRFIGIRAEYFCSASIADRLPSNEVGVSIMLAGPADEAPGSGLRRRQSIVYFCAPTAVRPPNVDAPVIAKDRPAWPSSSLGKFARPALQECVDQHLLPARGGGLRLAARCPRGLCALGDLPRTTTPARIRTNFSAHQMRMPLRTTQVYAKLRPGEMPSARSFVVSESDEVLRLGTADGWRRTREERDCREQRRNSSNSFECEDAGTP